MPFSLRLFLVLAFIYLPTGNTIADESTGWATLFNGANLDGWVQLNGDAEFRVEGDTIVGISKLHTPNSFLATRKSYSDFILEFEVNVDPRLNSGVQIRSLSKPNYRDGRVHGYQVEIDPSPRAFSGGIYDEARRGWLYPISRNPKAHDAFRNGQWNHVRVEAIGTSIRTWVNGIQCVDLVDSVTQEGFIALQVHSINDTRQAGSTVKWRNIKIKTSNLNAEKLRPDPRVPQISFLNNQLTQWEKRKGWRLLWDGKSSKGWRGANSRHFPKSGWKIKNGVLTIHGSGGKEAADAGDIITKSRFSEFELELEFKITEGANSGIKYFVQPQLNKGEGSAIGAEFQLLDDNVHPDAKQGVNGNRTLGSLYDLITAENISVPSRAKQFKGLDQWNQARIVSRNGIVEHWLNNEKIVEYDRSSQTFKALVAYSKYKKWPGFGQWTDGHILLQDHGHVVSFKNIKIREF